MKKKSSLITSSYLIAFMLYIVLVLLLVNDKNIIFWLGFIFTLIAFLIVVVTILLIRNDDKRDSFFYLPLILVENVYLGIQLVVNVILFMTEMTVKVAFITEVIPLGVFGIIACLTIGGRRSGENLRGETVRKTSYILQLEMIVQDCEQKVNDNGLKHELSRLKEKVHFSDPMSHEELSTQEEKILRIAEKIQGEIFEIEVAKENCSQLELLLDERNRRCKLLK